VFIGFGHIYKIFSSDLSLAYLTL